MITPFTVKCFLSHLSQGTLLFFLLPFFPTPTHFAVFLGLSSSIQTLWWNSRRLIFGFLSFESYILSPYNHIYAYSSNYHLCANVSKIFILILVFFICLFTVQNFQCYTVYSIISLYSLASSRFMLHRCIKSNVHKSRHHNLAQFLPLIPTFSPGLCFQRMVSTFTCFCKVDI